MKEEKRSKDFKNKLRRNTNEKTKSIVKAVKQRHPLYTSNMNSSKLHTLKIRVDALALPNKPE